MKKKIITNVLIMVVIVALSFWAGVLVKRSKANAETIGVFKLEYCEEVLAYGDAGLEAYGPIDTPTTQRRRQSIILKNIVNFATRWQ